MLELFFVRFFYKINKNWTVDKYLNCHIIVAATMNEFPKRSRASISKQTKQHILKAFNKIEEITHGGNEKVQNSRSKCRDP
jgi:CRISPR/Cas system-associated exonuclease Cas4 (RecB family)